MLREEMMKYINETLLDIPDNVLTELYWFLKIELGN